MSDYTGVAGAGAAGAERPQGFDKSSLLAGQARANELWQRKEAVTIVLQAHAGRDTLSVETLLKEAATVLTWLSATSGETIAPN